jgi:hypothetical protein
MFYLAANRLPPYNVFVHGSSKNWY